MNGSAILRYGYLLHISGNWCMVALLFFITACSATTNQTPTSINQSSPTTGISRITAFPTTKISSSHIFTNCPGSGKARAAFMPTLMPGNHANVVYLDSDTQDAYGTRIFDILQRYDIVTGKKTAIVRIANASIIDAQVSTDGQWVMFTTQQDQGYKIQLVRMDGKYLQTLYCFSSAYGIFYWSPDQKLLMFGEGPYPNPAIYPPSQPAAPIIDLLNLTNGNLQTEQLDQPDDIYTPLFWLDNTRIAIIHGSGDPGTPTFTASLYLLDTTKGPDQHLADLQRINGPYTDVSNFSSSIDGTQLFFTNCKGSSKFVQPPCSINVQPTLGGKVSSIYSSKTLVISTIQVINNTTLLFIVANEVGDSSQNGLWKINTDGTGLTRLTTETDPGTSIYLSHFSSYPWSAVSRDGSMFALQMLSGQATLLIGSMHTSKLITLASGSEDNWSESGIVGWTTM